MIRPTLLLLLLISALLPASAQASASARRIAVPVYGAEIQLSPDGTTLAAYTNAFMINNEVTPDVLPIHLYDVATGEQTGTLDGVQTDVVRDVAFSPDGARLVSLHFNGTLIVWDVATQSALQQIKWLPFGIGAVDFTPDGENVMLLTVGQLSQQMVFNLEQESITDILSLQLETYAAFQEESGNMDVMGTYAVSTQAIAPDGTIFAATANDELFRWDIDNHERLMLYPAVEGKFMRYSIRKIHIMADSTIVFYASTPEQTVMIAPDGTQSEFAFGSMQFAISGDGLMAYYDRDAEQIFVADLSENAEPQPLDVTFDAADEINPLTSLAFTPEGDLVIGGFRSEDDGSAVYVVDMP